MHTIEQPLRRGHRYGLTSVWVPTDLPEASATSERPFVHGVRWRGDQTNGPQAFEVGCAVMGSTDVDTDVPVVDAAPFGLIYVDRCTNVGSRAVDDGRARAQRMFGFGESYGLESVLATGNAEADGPAAVLAAVWGDPLPAGARYFEDAATVVTVAGVHGPTRTIAKLEQAFLDAEKMLGTIHVPITAFGLLAQAGAITLTEGRWRTALGSYVAAGAGYTGRRPDGTAAAADTQWVYMTGDVHAWRDPLLFLDSYGNPTHDNVRIASAQRQYVLAPDGATWLGAAMSLVAD